jgi:hypothetical protein
MTTQRTERARSAIDDAFRSPQRVQPRVMTIVAVAVTIAIATRSGGVEP